MKSFFVRMEEKFVFPIGRKTWQILALLSLLTLAASIVFFLINLTPTGRDSVSVSKNEVIENKIDTTAAAVPAAVQSCSLDDYKKTLDLIKADLPNAEWVKLGDSSDSYEQYVTDEQGNYIYDESGSIMMRMGRYFAANVDAIPNKLELIYSNRGLDSNNICEKIEILEALHYLNGLTSPAYRQKDAFDIYCRVMSASAAIKKYNLSSGFELMKLIEGEVPLFANEKDILKYFKYVEYLLDNSISQVRLDVASNLILEHRKLNSSEFDKADYFDLAKLIFNSSLPDEELKQAIDGFVKDIKFYGQNNMIKSLSRYLNIYNEKLQLAIEMQSLEKQKKANYRSISQMGALIGFGAVISIATILLLYSIQSLLKHHVSRNQ